MAPLQRHIGFYMIVLSKYSHKSKITATNKIIFTLSTHTAVYDSFCVRFFFCNFFTVFLMFCSHLPFVLRDLTSISGLERYICQTTTLLSFNVRVGDINRTVCEYIHVLSCGLRQKNDDIHFCISRKLCILY